MQADNKLSHFGYFFIKKTFGFLVRAIWIKEVTGLENIPQNGSAVIAFNHQSYFDFICFIAVCPRAVHFLSAEKFFRNFFWYPLVTITGQIRVDRHEHDKQLLHSTVYQHLHQGKIIGIFPEGTRAPDSREMLKAFTGAAKFAVRGKAPIIPVGIKGTHAVMSRHDKFPRFRKIVSIHIGQPVHLTEYHDKEHQEPTYRQITDTVMTEIAKLSGKNYSHHEGISNI